MADRADPRLDQRWALVVVDLQNDFLDRGGYYALRTELERAPDWDALSSAAQAERLEAAAADRPVGIANPLAAAVVDRVLEAIALAVQAGKPVLVVRAVYDRAYDVLPPRLAGDPERHHFPCLAGSWGAELVAPLARVLADSESPLIKVLDKHTYDAFFEPELLLAHLHEHDVDSLVFCGTETQTCVLASAQHAALLGYRSWILEDCVWSVDARLGSAALEIFRNAYGGILSLKSLQHFRVP